MRRTLGKPLGRQTAIQPTLGDFDIKMKVGSSIPILGPCLSITTSAIAPNETVP